MENRTKIVKYFMETIKTINSNDYSDIPEIWKAINQLPKVFESIAPVFDIVRKLKEKLPDDFQEIGLKTDEQFQRVLHYSKSEINQILGDEENEDFDKIISLHIAILRCHLNKTHLFSKERKDIKHYLGNAEKMKEAIDSYFNQVIEIINGASRCIKLTQLKQGNVAALKAIEVSLLLGKDENCYIKVDNVELHEDRAVRDTVGGYNGFSFRVAKGVSYRIGGFNAKGESHMEKRLIDKGIFYVTDKRYIFDGSTKNIEGELKKVISVEAYSDGIKISRANKRDEVFAGDMDGEYIGAAISALVKNINSECAKNSKQASGITLPSDNETEQIRTLLGQVKYQGRFLTKNEKQELLERWQSSVKSNREKIAQWYNDPDLNGFIIGVRYTAICDDRSCDFCRKHNGDVLKINDSRIKDNMPPIHLGCRCSWVAVTKIESEKKEIKFQWSDVEKPDPTLITF